MKGHFSGVVGYTDLPVDTKRGRFMIRQEPAPGSPVPPLTADRWRSSWIAREEFWGRRREEVVEQCRIGGVKNVAAVMAATSSKEGTATKVTV